MSDIVDRIDQLVDEQLAAGEPRTGHDFGDPKYPRCPHCSRHWHGLPITQRIAEMYAARRFNEDYRVDTDDSPVLCQGSEFIGPMPLPKLKDHHQAVSRLMDLSGLANSADLVAINEGAPKHDPLLPLPRWPRIRVREDHPPRHRLPLHRPRRLCRTGTPDRQRAQGACGGVRVMFVPIQTVAHYLSELHYLGSAHRGLAWSDEFGVIVLGPPTSRRLPGDWLEISRWCIESREPNAGSRQYAALRRELEATTVVSYSDPAVGHTGALYRACGFLWAPTWHRLRPPPTGNGAWITGERQAVKDRWVDPLRPDARRAEVLAVKDAAVTARMPWAEWREPEVRRGQIRRGTGGADYARFSQLQAVA